MPAEVCVCHADEVPGGMWTAEWMVNPAELMIFGLLRSLVDELPSRSIFTRCGRPHFVEHHAILVDQEMISGPGSRALIWV